MIWPPQSEPLEGTIVRLEPIAPSHREPLAAVSGEPDAWAWMDRRIPDERAAFDNWFDDWPAVRAALEAGIAAGGTPSQHLRTAEGASA